MVHGQPAQSFTLQRQTDWNNICAFARETNWQPRLTTYTPGPGQSIEVTASDAEELRQALTHWLHKYESRNDPRTCLPDEMASYLQVEKVVLYLKDKDTEGFIISSH